MPRKRFSADERAILASGPGTPVQVQNVTQWHDATLVTGEIVTEPGGWQHAGAKITHSRGSVLAGDPWPASPGHLRRAQ